MALCGLEQMRESSRFDGKEFVNYESKGWC